MNGFSKPYSKNNIAEQELNWLPVKKFLNYLAKKLQVESGLEEDAPFISQFQKNAL